MCSLLALSLLLCALQIRTTFADNINSDQAIFQKCCNNEESLVKVIQNESLAYTYKCFSSSDIEKLFNISSFPLFVNETLVQISYGIPDGCEELHMSNLGEPNVDMNTINENKICYDRLIVELVNDTRNQNIPKIVGLSCKDSKNVKINSNIKIDRIRKCCPNGEVYDRELHTCRRTENYSDVNFLMKKLNRASEVLEISVGLECKSTEYALELSEDKFIFTLVGNTLNISETGDDAVDQYPSNEWCVDQDYRNSKLVARVCTTELSLYNAYGLRKCCPMGYHFYSPICGRDFSVCQRDADDEVLFNITTYIDPLKKSYDEHIVDVIGIKYGILCPDGKFLLKPEETRQLTADGVLRYKALSYPRQIYYSHDFCLEVFDRRHCNLSTSIIPVACFYENMKPEHKDFEVAFVLNCMSAVCLALTLLVYMSLPELRNLHGRTLMCHVGMMLLAYSCLARVQYSIVKDENLCTALGYGIYFGFVGAFAWLNVMCFDIWWTFGSVRSVQTLRKSGTERKRFIWYSAYAWTISISLTITMLLLDLYPLTEVLDAEMGNLMCWFGAVQNDETFWPHYIFFVVPMGLVTCTNFILWILTARYCARVKSEVHRMQAGSFGDRAKKRFRIDRAKYVLTGKLWVVMGAGWISELLSTLIVQPQWLWMVVDLINELQGVLIFIILCFKPKLYYIIRKRLGFSRTPAKPRLGTPDPTKNGTASTNRTSSTFLSRTISSDDRANLRISTPNK